MRKEWLLLVLLVAACGGTPSGTVIGERDFEEHIPPEARARLTDSAHGVHPFTLGQTGARVEARIETAQDTVSGIAWVRSARFVVVEGAGVDVEPLSIGGPVRLDPGSSSYSFSVSYATARSCSGVHYETLSGRFGGNGFFEVSPSE